MSLRSLRGLDIVNLLMTDVKDGVGVYLSIYLLTIQKWDAAEIGIVIALPGFIGIVVQPLMGAWIDNTRHKRMILISSSFIIALCCLSVIMVPTFTSIALSQSLLGFVQSTFAPCVAAISLGIVGHSLLSRRIGRNESFNHLGNMLAAIVAGLIGYFISYEGIFFFSIIQCLALIIVTFIIREKDIDHQLARAAVIAPHIFSITNIKDLFADKNILLFTASMALFHLANAAMLPLLGQKMGLTDTFHATLYLSASIIIAQGVMIFVATTAGKKADQGRKKILAIAFLLIPVRAILFSFISDPIILTSLQIIDGLGAGIFGVVTILMMADLSKGTGHFNLLQGIVYSSMGLGAALSSIYSGYVVKHFGYSVGFYCIAMVGFLGFCFFTFFVKETLGIKEGKVLQILK
jgi:MFS family permease